MEMFCFQCQETAKNSGCTVHGVCGKSPEVARMMDELIAALKQIAMTRTPNRKLGLFVVQSLFMTITNANFDPERLKSRLTEALSYVGAHPGPCGVGVQSCADPEVRSRRELLLYGLKGLAAYADHAAMLGKWDTAIGEFVFKALAATAAEEDTAVLTELILECGQTAVRTMALLDEANTETYGAPRITKVKTGVGKRPGILVSGHDLRDLAELLEQSKDAGIDIYTHSEMLPAHYYPELKKYTHLYGNYGNAWHRQNVEFAAFHGPILMTTNCITPVQDSYRERIFTTGMAGYPGVPHIADRTGEKPKDFSRIIALAQTCPPPDELENGEIIGGFAHDQVMLLADKIVAAVKSGAIRKFIVMAGCDGRSNSRDYYRAVAEALPRDTVILTAGCAKYRYLKLPLGEIEGIPRVLDAGQCNDSYSLAVIAMKLKEAFQLEDVNDLPLAFDIAWYEQKAVAVLLALLALGFRNLRIGPTLPAFLSPGVAKLLTEEFGIRPISDPETDVASMMGH